MKLPPHLPIKYGFDQSLPPPEAPDNNAQFTASSDHRLWLYHRQWEPKQRVPIVATLMILHGTVDHSGVYDELAGQLTRHGIAVIAPDLRGWGRSDGESMYFHDMDTFVSDVNHLYTTIHSKPRYQTVKARFLLGKSLGGIVAAYCVANYPDQWTGLLGLSGAYSTGDGIHKAPIVAMTILDTLSPWLAKISLKKLFDEHLIVSDAAALHAWKDDDLCSKDKVRVGYIVELSRCIKELFTNDIGIAKKIAVPMLMLWGEDDHVVSLSGHERLLQQSQSKDTALKTYKGGRHNLLQEPSLKEQVVRDIQEWILARCE